VLLLEKGRHPRITIGESSTPLANLLLEELADRYDLPAVRPLAKWGSWQQAYPQVGCGLKRGFTFYHHRLGMPDSPDHARANELLVAASPHDTISDTHWYRADFDMLLVQQAQQLGVEYVEEALIQSLIPGKDCVEFDLSAHGANRHCSARFLIDATGPRGLLHQSLALPESIFDNYPYTEALYSHFTGVSRPEVPHHLSAAEHLPYPAEDAAVHHLFEGGWIWVLRFNNGITSAGVAATRETANLLRFAEGEQAWTRLLDLLPTLKSQFSKAQAIQPFRHLSKLSFLSGQVHGERWTLLPSAAGFVDPLLSTGFPLALLGIARLASILERGLDSSTFQTDLNLYAATTEEELRATAGLIATLYANINRFEVFKALCLLYFAAASYSETVRRLNKPHLAVSFLLCQHPDFGPATQTLLSRATTISSETETSQLVKDIHRTIEPFDVAGLTRRDRTSWYPVDAEDLLSSAAKVQSRRDEIQSLLTSCGFYPSN
jgi:FADH2 O2-dependent halogenase